jgi:hypothetical protein
MKIPRRPRSKNRRLTPKQVRQVNEYALRTCDEMIFWAKPTEKKKSYPL